MSVRDFGGSRFRWTLGVFVIVIFCGGFSASPGAVEGATNSQSITAKVRRPYYSPGLSEVLRLLGAKVNPEVVKAYIKSSPVLYDLTPETIIALKHAGVSDDVITALLQRDAEVRAQMATLASESYAPSPSEGYMPPEESSATYGTEPSDNNYPGYYDYGYPYTYWGWYNSWYPWAYAFYSPLYVDRFGHRHFRDFDHFGRFDGFGSKAGFARRQNFAFNNHSGQIFFGKQPPGVGGRIPYGRNAPIPSGVGGKLWSGRNAPRPSGVGGRISFGGNAPTPSGIGGPIGGSSFGGGHR